MTRAVVVALMFACSSVLVAQAPVRTLRVAVAMEQDDELRSGLAFGIDEARRSMALFGWRLEIDTIAQGIAVAAVNAVVASQPVGSTGGVPLLLLSCAHSAGAFVVAACPSAGGLEWHPTLERFGAGQLNDRYRAATGRGMSAAAWRAWFAVKVLTETAMRARDPARIAERLRESTTRFDGHKGVALRFDTTGALLQPLYEISRDAAGAETVRERRSP